MKKVLILTTALVATGSVAAADVRLSGYGRFGLDYNSANSTDATGNNTRDMNLTSRLRLQFDMSAETDNGVGFNARFRAQADNRNNNPGGAVFNAPRFGVTYSGFTLNVGNILGAVDNMPGLYLPTTSVGTGVDGSGFQSLVLNSAGRQWAWDAYNSTGTSSGAAGQATGFEVIYSQGGFTGQLSYSQTNPKAVPIPGVAAPINDQGTVTATGIMLAYTFGDWTVAAARQQASLDGATNDKADLNAAGLAKELTAVSVGGTFGQFGVGLAYGDNDGVSKYRLYGSVDVGVGGSLVAWVAQEDDNTNAAGTTFGGNSYGVNYEYDLGGGVTLVAGLVSYRNTAGTNLANSDKDITRAQTGVVFRF
ncbi:porin [Chachezhania sediminis]|uniref:porin n=1 Tax=Chachezhania sediminis TaxID=2599291 RepID=UPI00131B7853|nr:porin [Chachezhania sediminis]